MKFASLVACAALATAALTGCCGWSAKPKCYPYPLYNYSPAKICGATCAAPACAAAPCNACATAGACNPVIVTPPVGAPVAVSHHKVVKKVQ